MVVVAAVAAAAATAAVLDSLDSTSWERKDGRKVCTVARSTRYHGWHSREQLFKDRENNVIADLLPSRWSPIEIIKMVPTVVKYHRNEMPSAVVADIHDLLS